MATTGIINTASSSAAPNQASASSAAMTTPGSTDVSDPTLSTNATTSPQATANAVDLSAPQMTISGNIGNYLDPNSSVNQLLATKAKQVANQSGTLNSSLTDSAISNGIIANAQAMAQNDQNAYASGAQTNAQLANQTSATNANNASSQLIANMNNDNQIQMTNLNNSNKTLLQESSAAANIYQTAIQQIASIQQNSSMDQATKDTQTANIISTTNAELADQASLSGLNVGSNFANLTVGGSSPSLSTTNTTTPSTQYTAPDGSIWSSEAAYNKSQGNLVNQVLNGV